MTATAHHTPSAAERAFYQCPDWCERWDHSADGVSFEHPPVHYGPQFGPVHTQHAGLAPEAIVYAGKEAGYVSDPRSCARSQPAPSQPLNGSRRTDDHHRSTRHATPDRLP